MGVSIPPHPVLTVLCLPATLRMSMGAGVRHMTQVLALRGSERWTQPQMLGTVLPCCIPILGAITATCSRWTLRFALQNSLNWESWDPPLVGSSPSHASTKLSSLCYHPLFSCQGGNRALLQPHPHFALDPTVLSAQKPRPDPSPLGVCVDPSTANISCPQFPALLPSSP